MTPMRSAWLLPIAVLTLAACAPDAVPDRQRGDAAPPASTPPVADRRLPLNRILEIARHAVPGEVIDVELDQDDDPGEVAYEVSILTPDGRAVEIKIDARTGTVIEIEED
jgi:uncharacterized membrane protein YkoI